MNSKLLYVVRYVVAFLLVVAMFLIQADLVLSCQFATVPNDTQDLDVSDALTGTTAIRFANSQRALPCAVAPQGQ